MKKIYLSLLLVAVTFTALKAQIFVTETGGTQGNDGTSWDAAYDKSKLQEAINEAENATVKEVWVAKGTYNPTEYLTGTADIDKSFILRNGVKIYGGFAGGEPASYDLNLRNFTTNATILSGDFGGGINARHVVVNIANISGAVLDGFTITGGKATGSGNSGGVTRSTGGGMSINTNASISFTNLIIENNSATGNGGGVYLSLNATGQEEKAIFTNVKFINNKGARGGTLYAITDAGSTALLEITNSNFSGSEGTLGGALYIYRIPTNILGTTFENTLATGNGGVINIEYGTHKISSSRFLNNTSTATSAIYIFRGILSLNNSIFYKNENVNSIIHVGSSTAKGTLNATNNTFYENKIVTPDATAGVITYRNTSFGETNLYNNIFRNNTDASNNLFDISREIPSSGVILRLKSNLLETDYTLTNTNVTVSNNKVYTVGLPLFGTNTANPAAADFLNLVEGQATEAGDNDLAKNAAILSDPDLLGTDLVGNPRKMHTNIDLGALEYQGTLPVQFDYFKAKKEGATANLTWRTLAENNNSHFIVQRGSSTADFVDIKRIEANGNTNEPKTYNYIDQNPLAGINYYRLVQYDYNGDHEVLGEQALTFTLNGSQNLVYPNPASKYVSVKFTSVSGIATIDLVNLTGQNVISKDYSISASGEITIDLSGVSAGTYVLWINKGKANNDKKLLVVK